MIGFVSITLKKVFIKERFQMSLFIIILFRLDSDKVFFSTIIYKYHIRFTWVSEKFK